VIDKVRIANGNKLIYKAFNPGLGRVIDDRHVAMMNQMMQETLTTGTARKAALAGWPSAGKSGTSQDYRDAWFIGYTGHLVTGVWLGNDDNSSTKKLTGGAMPADIWNHFMTAAHQGLPMADLPGMAGRTIDPATQQPGTPPGSVLSNPLTSMLAPILPSPTAAPPMSREDDMRPLVQPAPPRPPVAVMPLPPAPAPIRAPAPRPSQVVSAPLPPASLTLAPRAPAPPSPPSRVASPPQPRVPPAAQSQYGTIPPPSQPTQQPQRVATAPAPSSGVPRPPGAIGAQEARVQPVSTNNSSGGSFFDNLFGRR
jgi:penicillin-binding protein 1A